MINFNELYGDTHSLRKTTITFPKINFQKWWYFTCINDIIIVYIVKGIE